MIHEAGYIYSLRHGIDFSRFTEDYFLQPDFPCDQGSEFDNICQDLRKYRYFDWYELHEISEEEYQLCLDKFGTD